MNTGCLSLLLKGQRDCGLVSRRNLEKVLNQRVDVGSRLQSDHRNLVLCTLSLAWFQRRDDLSQLVNVALNA